MWRGLLLACLVMSGCLQRHWTPDSDDKARAELIISEYMGISRDAKDQAAQVEGIPFSQFKRVYIGRVVDGRKELIVRFFDPVHFPDWESSYKGGLEGGFPWYFEFTLDIESNSVLRYYGERE